MNDILELALNKNIIKEIPGDADVKRMLIDKIKKDHPDLVDEDELFYNSSVEQTAEKGLPIPPEIEGEVPDMPLDLTVIADKEIRFLHGAFNACAARSRWLYSFEEAGVSAAQQIADYYEEEYFVRADRKDYGGKAKAASLLKAEAKNVYPQILKWRKREQKHSINANKYKRLTETYDTNCERLSREWTMRTTEKDN